MKLTAKVTDTHSASQYADNTRRVTLKVEEADCMNTRLTVRSDDLREDDELVVLVLTKAEAQSVFEFADKYDSSPAQLLTDQLRPDPLPPFLTDDEFCKQEAAKATATTQEFGLRGAV